MTDSHVSRRSFLAAAAASAAGASLGVASFTGTAAASEPGPRQPEPSVPPGPDIRLGVASYSLRKFPLEKALEMMKVLRTPYLNFKSVHVPYEKSPQELAVIRKQIQDAGFQIVGGGTIDFAKDDDDDVRRLFEYAKAAGMPTMVATCNAPLLPRIEKFARQFDIKVALHNHGPEDTHFPSPYDVLAAVKNMDPRMGLCIDLGHTVRTGTDPVKAILDAGPRVLDIHAKDLRDLKSRESQCIVGDGAIPFAEIFSALQRIRFAGFVNLEYEIDADDPMPGMRLSFAHMRGVLAGLAVTTRG